MKAVILAGGLGTRISEYTEKIPKPMVQISDLPILLHIMDIFSHYGHNDGFDGQLTANGEIFDQHGLSAAHKTLPLNSWIKVTNLDRLTKPSVKLSSSALSGFPITPGRSRTQASSNAIANGSPPDKTKSPMLTSSIRCSSITRWSIPS